MDNNINVLITDVAINIMSTNEEKSTNSGGVSF